MAGVEGSLMLLKVVLDEDDGRAAAVLLHLCLKGLEGSGAPGRTLHTHRSVIVVPRRTSLQTTLLQKHLNKC